MARSAAQSPVLPAPRSGPLVVAIAFLVLVLVVGADGSASRSPSGATPGPARANRRMTRSATRWPIKHVIYIVKENRTFDQYFGLFPGADGATRGRTRTGWRPLKRGIPDVLPHDLQHSKVSATLAYDGGRMDGFAHDTWSRRYAYSEARPRDIPMYWRWARHFVLADRFFSSERGPSFPNHLFSIAASAAGTTENPKRLGKTGAQWTWGCDAPANTEVQVRGPAGATTSTRPCFDLPTLGDRLNRRGVSWAYYAATIREAGYIWSAYDAIDHVRTTGQWRRHVRPVDRLVSNIRAGRLPAVTWVTPRFELSEHPDFSLCHGENWTTRVVNAVMDGPMWKDTAVFITWDDWGGFYDHARPPRIGGQGLGFRVPMLLLSPFARSGHVDHRTSDFTSVLRFIEDNWRVAPLTPRDRALNGLARDFNFAHGPRSPDPQPLRRDCKGPALTLPPRTQR